VTIATVGAAGAVEVDAGMARIILRSVVSHRSSVFRSEVGV
jgi:hypothetical protein